MRLIPCYTNNGLYYYYYLSVGHWACVLDPAFCGLLPKVNWTSLQWRILWNVPNDAEKYSVHLFLVLYKYTCGRVILHTLQATSATHIAHVFKAPFWTSTWHDVGVLSSPGFSRFCRNSQCHHHSSGQWWIMKRLPTTLFQSSPSVEIVNACSPGFQYCISLPCSARVSRVFWQCLFRSTEPPVSKHTLCKTRRSIMTSVFPFYDLKTDTMVSSLKGRNVGVTEWVWDWLFQWLIINTTATACSQLKPLIWLLVPVKRPRTWETFSVTRLAWS